jgi:hypothetical protein
MSVASDYAILRSGADIEQSADRYLAGAFDRKA